MAGWAQKDATKLGFVETVRLSQSFYDALSRHPVPLWEPAIGAIQNLTGC